MNVYLTRTDSSGEILWTRIYGGGSGHSVQQTDDDGDGNKDDGYVIAGTYGDADYDVYLIKTDSLGDTLWTRTYGGGSGHSVQQTADGGYVIAGGTNNRVCLIKTDSLGDTLWTRTYGGGSGYSVQQTDDDGDGNKDDGYVIAGTYGDADYDVYLIKTNSSGDTLWTRTYGGEQWDGGYSVQQTTDGGYIITGVTCSFGAGGEDFYLIKTNPEGYVGILDNNPPVMELPRSWALSQNYPNPFNPSTTIAFDIPGNSAAKQHVTLAVYDIRGRLVKTLISSELEPRNHKVTWNGKDESGKPVPSGIYLYTLKAGEERHTCKMTVLK